jgi:hypothetical protein
MSPLNTGWIIVDGFEKAAFPGSADKGFLKESIVGETQ